MHRGTHTGQKSRRAASPGRAGAAPNETRTAVADQELTVAEPVVDWTPPSIDSGVPSLSSGPLHSRRSSSHPSASMGGSAIVAPRRGRRYLELGELGKGGMGVVYTAYDVELDRKVALKVLRTNRSDNKELGVRLKREAQAMAKLSHPNVAQVYDVGELEGQVYIAMERISGSTLREWSKFTVRSWDEVVDVFLQAGRGLAAAHAEGVIHRDFKPDNVMVGDDGRVRVLDFGLARRHRERGSDAASSMEGIVDPTRASVTKGNVIGTPAYMSPEQHIGNPVDERADQYAFCVALFEALYGTRPFVGRNTEDLAARKLKLEFADIEDTRGVPQWLHAVAARGLSVEPGERYASMPDLIEALTPKGPETGRRWLWPTIAGFLVLALVGVIAGSYVIAQPTAAEEQSAVEELTRQALDAGSRGHWVFPPSDDPDVSSLRRVFELEELENGANDAAKQRADELREQFAAGLKGLGDEYWNTETGRGFARDFYVQALMFDPRNDELRSRTGMTRGEISDFRERARTGTFTPEEVRAAAVFAALAEADEDTRLEKLEEVIEEGADERSEGAQRRLESLVTTKRERSGAPPRRVEKPAEPKGDATVTSDETPADPPTDPVAEVDKPAQRAESQRLVKSARTLATRGRTKEAVRLFNRALDLDPRNAAATMGLSDLYFNQSKYTRALQYAKRGVKLAPKNGSYHLRLGDAYYKLSRFSEARREYKSAKRLGVREASERLAKVKDALGR